MSETSTISDENFALLMTNQSFDVISNDLVPVQIEHHRDTILDDDDIRSEALIKQIHPFVFPKQFNTIDGIPNRGNNTTNDQHISVEVNGIDDLNNERLDDNFAPIEQKHQNADLIPMSSHFFDRPAKGHSNYGYFDRPHQHQSHQMFSHNNNCLLGLLHGCDPLILMGILGFLAYVINSILNLVNRVNLPLLTPATSTEMNTAAAAATKALLAQHHIIDYDDHAIESNQKLLKDFERILQMAIDIYDHKINNAN